MKSSFVKLKDFSLLYEVPIIYSFLCPFFEQKKEIILQGIWRVFEKIKIKRSKKDVNISFRTSLGGTIFMWYIWWRGRGIKDITLAESKTLQTQPPNSCLTHSVGSGMVPTSHRILLNMEAKSSLCLLHVKQSEVTMVEIAASPFEGLRALPTSPELSCPWFHPETSNVKTNMKQQKVFQESPTHLISLFV